MVAPGNEGKALSNCQPFTLKGMSAESMAFTEFDYCSPLFQSLAYPLIPEGVDVATVDQIDNAQGIYQYDAYTNVVQLPDNMSAEELFADAIFNLEEYLNKTVNNPGGDVWTYHMDPQWDSGIPSEGDFIVENIKFTGSPFGEQMSASLQVIDSADDRVVLVAVSEDGKSHPLPGSRELGFYTSPFGLVSFYVRSVARSGHSLVELQPQTDSAVSNADTYASYAQDSWVHWIAGINEKITELGGTIIDPIGRAINTSPEKPMCN